MRTQQRINVFVQRGVGQIPDPVLPQTVAKGLTATIRNFRIVGFATRSVVRDFRISRLTMILDVHKPNPVEFDGIGNTDCAGGEA